MDNMNGKPYSAEETQQIVEQFHRDGYYFLGEVLTEEEVNTLRDGLSESL